MESSDLRFDKFMKIQKYALLFAGIWPFRFTENKLISLGYEVYKKFQLVAYSLFLLSLITEFFVLIAEQNQRARIFASVNVLITLLQDRFRLIIYQTNRIPQMYFHVMKYEKEIFVSSDKEIQDYYNRQARYCKRVNTLQIFTTCTAGILFTAASFIKVATAADMSVFKDQPIMGDMWLPFKREENTSIVLAFGTYCLILSTLYNTSTQTTFVGLMIFAGTRLRILRMSLRKFDVIAKEKHNNDVLSTIRGLIIEHQFLIRFVRTFNNRTKYVMLMEYLLNSVNVASITVQLLMVRSTIQFLAVIGMSYIVVIQICILYWSANEIRVESFGISTAILESNWVDQPESIKKLLLFMIMTAQSPLALTAGPFFEMTTDTALTIFKVAYSYLSIMM